MGVSPSYSQCLTNTIIDVINLTSKPNSIPSLSTAHRNLISEPRGLYAPMFQKSTVLLVHPEHHGLQRLVITKIVYPHRPQLSKLLIDNRLAIPSYSEEP